MRIVFEPIGAVHTPYSEKAPRQPMEDDESGEFLIELFPLYRGALRLIDRFRYVYVLFYMDRTGYRGNAAHPPGLKGGSVGLFASRSPHRPNAIGLDVARIIEVVDDLRLRTSGLSALDGSPLLDLKPYTPGDVKPDANPGWISGYDETSGQSNQE
ncbi:tRNA (N6-threonylcarbamoyladenosine(37)-N6)-methyltransferase TrmO [Candidatus Fermentibacteria bacterium]|nr:tRNA (N6-threonylcarbamoyladenosine(37)-N6)-methyltransferase TrmO [Candidatus Fermentibacteria bacterium]